MKFVFADEAWEDYLFWQRQDKRMVERINKLIRETQREPFTGLGKPEPLQHALSGYWSRRITEEHHMVYKVDGNALLLRGILSQRVVRSCNSVASFSKSLASASLASTHWRYST